MIKPLKWRWKACARVQHVLIIDYVYAFSTRQNSFFFLMNGVLKSSPLHSVSVCASLNFIEIISNKNSNFFRFEDIVLIISLRDVACGHAWAEIESRNNNNYQIDWIGFFWFISFSMSYSSWNWITSRPYRSNNNVTQSHRHSSYSIVHFLCAELFSTASEAGPASFTAVKHT